PGLLGAALAGGAFLGALAGVLLAAALFLRQPAPTVDPPQVPDLQPKIQELKGEVAGLKTGIDGMRRAEAQKTLGQAEIALRIAETEVEVCRVQLKHYQQEVARAEKQLDGGVGSKTQAEAAKAALDQTQVSLDGAEKRRDSLTQTVKRLKSDLDQLE